MEKSEKIVKVYSNNSKKTRLKRRKNKFQRTWDAEKQTYVKVRKAKFPVRTKVEVKPKSVDEIVKAAYARADKRSKAKKTKSVPVNATKMEQKVAKVVKSEKHAVNATPVHRKATSVKLYGRNLEWDKKTLRYKAAA